MLIIKIPACHLSGEMSQDEELCVYTELSRREPGIKLLYVTPEKVSNLYETTCIFRAYVVHNGNFVHFH